MPRPAVWIEAYDYGRRILALGVEPWSRPVELGLFYRQLADLLRPQLIELPLLFPMRTRFATTLNGIIDAHEAAAAVCDLLRAGEFQALLREGLDAMAGAGLRCDLALSLPGPRALIVDLAPDAVPGIDEDVLDMLSLTLTDVVRTAAGVAPARLMLNESSADALDACDMLLNLACDYRIPVTLIGDHAVSRAGVGPVMPAATACAWSASSGSCVLPDRLWQAPEEVDAALWRDAQIVRLVVPHHAEPETVMKALARITT